MATNSKFDGAFHHPLFTGKILLPTEPINELYPIIKRALILRETGCCLGARSGIGKTSALEMIYANLQYEFPTLPIFRHNTHNHQIPSIRAFFKHFLATIRHAEKKGETYDLRERLVNCLIDDARISGMNLVLLLIDEAHAMAVLDFNFLKDIYNDLAKEGVQLVTILMGQEPELSTVIDKLRIEARLDLISRFAMRKLPFRGFNCKDDLRRIHSGIDEAVDSDGIPWTGFFFPQAFQNGFRLVNETDPFFEAIAAAAPRRTDGTFEFPARQTFLAIRAFFTDNCGDDKHGMQLPANAWSDAVVYAKLKEAMLLIRAGDQAGDFSVEI
jgi:hypothetical protein